MEEHGNKSMDSHTEAIRRYVSEVPIFPTTCYSQSSFRVICNRTVICVLLLAVVVLSSVFFAIFHYGTNKPEICHSKECLRSAAAFQQSMDLTVDPCEDFYSYVCGNWAADHPRPVASRMYNWIDDRQLKIFGNIMAMLEMNISQSDPKPVAQSKMMYKACLDTATREQQGFNSIAKYLKEFGLPTIPTLLNYTESTPENFTFDWISSVARIYRKLGIKIIIGFDIVPDYQNKTRNRLTFSYYSTHKTTNSSSDGDENYDKDSEKDNGNTTKISKALKQLIEVIQPSINTTNIHDRFSKLAEQLIEFNQTLPDKPEYTEEDPSYLSVQELQNLTDSCLAPRNPIPIWQRYLDVLFADLPDVKPTAEDKLQIDNATVEYLQQLVDAVSKHSDARIELYVWMMVTSYLVNNTLNVIKTDFDCTDYVQAFMGLAVNYAISEKDFFVETKPRVERMLHDIRTQFDRFVVETDWMDKYTTHNALEKSEAMSSFIGFPEWILDVEKLEHYYEGLQINDSCHLENWINATHFLLTDKLQSWRLENNRFSVLNTVNVNAYYIPEWNLIHIPVAIIKYPFYYLGLEALNYGALGDILGHEFTHAFDNTGRLIDKHGNKKSWWSNQTIQEYDDRANCLVDQYSNYYVTLAKSYVNGTLTLGENIADNGGLRQAFWAYRLFAKEHGLESSLPGFEDFTHEQLLFISFANVSFVRSYTVMSFRLMLLPSCC
ncbi:neprilysin-11-like isoform X2 [Topomyia yanbarensis]|uniref:neprilysin-11-like isoform X2 n=1 Tax=Topomyia yanbarensis TaxID=2498891 RepID=UPI00273BCE3D|nr:neprilysin-11-like isoform X2 [Topomyia yanbarensis]